MNLLIEAKSTTAKISTMDLRQWKGIHPVSKNLVVGYMIVLTSDTTIEFERPNSSSQNKSTNSNKSSGPTSKSEFLESSDLEGEDF